MTQKQQKRSKVVKPVVDKTRSAVSSENGAQISKKVKKSPKLSKKKLEKALEKAQNQADKFKTQLAYVQAEYENYVKSMERREANIRLQANRNLILSLLPILDDLEQAQIMVPQIKANEPFIDGLNMLVENLKVVLTNAGVKEIDCEGHPFDPLRHEVVIREETTTVPPNIIIEDLRKGYLLKGILLRPTMVKIAVAPTSSPEAESGKIVGRNSTDNSSIKKK